ncbi:MAG: hypothetical protein AAF724_21820 [Pseudomonadota bacterium]
MLGRKTILALLILGLTVSTARPAQGARSVDVCLHVDPEDFEAGFMETMRR